MQHIMELKKVSKHFHISSKAIQNTPDMSEDEEEITATVFCCKEKERLLQNNLFLKRISVKPEILIFTKFEKCRTFKKTFEIKNEDVNPIGVEISSDFSNDLGLQGEKTIYIYPELTASVEVIFEPNESTRKNPRNCRRHSVFITMQHPKLTVEFPILVCRGKPEVVFPRTIFFPKCAVGITSYYTMAVYNPDNNSTIFSTKWKIKRSSVKILSESREIPGQSCSKTNFCVTPSTYHEISYELMIYSGTKQLIYFRNEVQPYEPFVSSGTVRFPSVSFGYSSGTSFHVCNESDEPIKIKWCRRSKKPEVVMDEECSQFNEPTNIKQINESFSIVPKSATIPSISSLKIYANFTPKPLSAVEPKECTKYPLRFKSVVYLAFNTNNKIRMPLILTGLGKGPEMVLNFSNLELGSVVLGEKRCVRVKVTNSGSIPGIIHFLGSDGKFGGVATAYPVEQALEPGDEKTFVIEYYGTALGKFMEKLIFDILDGSSVYMVISGIMEPIRVKVRPETLDFGNVDICSMQRKELTVINPLSVPIVVSMETENDGVQEPLIITNFYQFVESVNQYEDECFSDHLNDIKNREATQKVCFKDNSSTSNLGSSTTPSQCSFSSGSEFETRTVASKFSCKSSGFIEVVDKSSEIAAKVVHTATTQNVIEDPQPDLRIMENVIDKLLSHNYFAPMVDEMNHSLKTMTIPKKPREYLVNPQPFIIDAFSSSKVPVFLAPNKNGHGSVVLNLKTTIFVDDEGSGESLSKARNIVALPEEMTITTVFLKHNCQIPELKLPENLELETHLDLPTKFDFKIANTTEVPGIVAFTFDKLDEAEVTFAPQKANVIESLQSIDCTIKITSRVPGEHKIIGNIQIFGSRNPVPLTFRCHAELPKVKVSPTPVLCDLKVLQSKMCMAYILNAGSSLVQYKARTKLESQMTCNPNEGVLYPKECNEIFITALFCDPGEFRTMLFLDVKHLDPIKVPIHVTASGLPIKFSPDLKKGLDLKLKSISNNPLIVPITMTNCGQGTYKMFITKKPISQDKIESSHFDFAENSFNLLGGESYETEIILTRPKSMHLKEEFRVDGIISRNHKRIRDFTFFSEVNLIHTKLKWSKPKLLFEFKNSDFCEMSFGEPVIVTNTSEITENIEFITVGSFQIFDSEKHKFWKNFLVDLEPGESKELIICFEAREINKWNSDVEYEGKILAKSPETSFKSLPLTCKITFPIITMRKKSIRYHTLKSPFVLCFDIENTGELLAFYQWSHHSVPTKQCIAKVSDPHWVSVADYINSNEMKGLYSNFIDVQKEFQISFQKSLDYNFEDQNDFDEGEEGDEEGSEITGTVDSISNPKNGKQKRSKKRDIVENPKFKTMKSITATRKSKTKVTKKNKESEVSLKSKSSEKNLLDQEVPMEKDNLVFVIEESKLEVELDEIIERAHKVFQYPTKNKCSEQSPEELFEIARLLQVEPVHNIRNEMYFHLDHYRGSLKPETSKTMNLHFVGEPEEVEIKAALMLDVVGGKSEQLDITVINCRSEIEVSQTEFDLGNQPWYNLVYRKVHLTNFNDNSVQLKTVTNVYQSKENRLSMGFVNVGLKDFCLLKERTSVAVDAVVYLGINNRFSDGFGIELNRNITAAIQFRGSGTIPMMTVLNLERLQADDLPIEREYEILNDIYLQHIRHVKTVDDAITQEEIVNLKNAIGIYDYEEELEGLEETEKQNLSNIIKNGHPSKWVKSSNSSEKNSKSTNESVGEFELFTQSSKLGHSESNFIIPTIADLYVSPKNAIEISYALKEPKFRATVIETVDSELSEYCVLDYPAEYPCMIQLHNVVKAQHFLHSMKQSNQLQKRFRNIVKKYVLADLQCCTVIKPKKYERPIKPTSFVMQPLPFYSESYRLDFGIIYLNEKINYPIELFNHGPGKVNFSARTLIPIPGMEIKFLDPDFRCYGNEGNFKFSVYNNTLEKKKNSIYKNMKMRGTEELESMRSLCGECGTELCHAHSYDFNSQIHTREVDPKARKAINEFYSWRNKPFKEIKDPNIHCEIFQERGADAKNKIFKLNISFKPTAECYKNPTYFEDFLYIDIHLGPTIPILLQATIQSRELKVDEERVEEKTEVED